MFSVSILSLRDATEEEFKQVLLVEWLLWVVVVVVAVVTRLWTEDHDHGGGSCGTEKQTISWWMVVTNLKDFFEF